MFDTQFLQQIVKNLLQFRDMWLKDTFTTMANVPSNCCRHLSTSSANVSSSVLVVHKWWIRSGIHSVSVSDLKVYPFDQSRKNRKFLKNINNLNLFNKNENRENYIKKSIISQLFLFYSKKINIYFNNYAMFAVWSLWNFFLVCGNFLQQILNFLVIMRHFGSH